MRLFFLGIYFLTSIFLTGCGYYFQGTKNPLKDLGIQRIYVEAFTNKSYRPGIEQVFTTAMIREIEKSKVFKLVNSPKAADAVLKGSITSADSSLSATTPTTLSDNSTYQVISTYNASVACSFSLEDSAGITIFAQSISGQKVYPGSVITGEAGATVPLVNESEQRLAYQFLASQMMANLYQRMIDIF